MGTDSVALTPKIKDRADVLEAVPLVEFMYLVFTRMPGQSYCRHLRSLLLSLCDVFEC